MQNTSRPAPADIDVRALGSLALKCLPRLIALSACVGAATYGVLMLVAPRYSSEAVVAIISKASANPYADPSRAGASDFVSVRMDKEAINTHVSALKSQDLAVAVAQAMKLNEKVEFNSALGAPDKLTAILNTFGIDLPRAGESEQARVLNAFAKRLEVYSPKESRSIGIRFTASDPELAAEVANKLAEMYRATLARQTISETDDVQKALEPRIAMLSVEAANAESMVEKFRGEANIFKSGQQQTDLNDQQLTELNAELSKVKAAHSDADARAKQAREMLVTGSADALADVQKSPVMQNLTQSRVRLERQISELSATLLPGHPRMRQLAADLAGLKSQINTEVAKIVDGLSKEAKVAASREDAVAKSVSEIKARIVKTGPDEARLRSLEADAKSKRAELERLKAQYEANRIRAGDTRAVPVEAQILSNARPASIPVFPKKTASALLAAVATLMIGLALVITRGLLAGQSHATPVYHRQSTVRTRAEPVLPPATRTNTVKDIAPLNAKAERRLFATAPPSEPAPKNAAPISLDRGTPEVRQPEAGMPAASSADPAVNQPSEPRHVSDLADVADRLEALRKRGLSGTRTLIAGNTDPFSLATEIRKLTHALADRGLTVIVVDWSLDGTGIAEALGEASWPGFIELVKEQAHFEDVVVPLNETGIHLIAAGHGKGEAGADIDPESVASVLDALDGVYDHILVTAQNEPARLLFEAIEGRFDCGISMSAAGRPQADSPGTFLGFEVEGMELIAFEVASPSARTSARTRLARVG
ncbi:MAG: exopolysaccharide transport family protein [Hyphomicrobium sp.]|jgi:uncharacterized protein involved in exopolysaccharide biosynthesis